MHSQEWKYPRINLKFRYSVDDYVRREHQQEPLEQICARASFRLVHEFLLCSDTRNYWTFKVGYQERDLYNGLCDFLMTTTHMLKILWLLEI